MSYDHILFDMVNDVARITLNRPQSLNAMGKPMLSELIDAFGRLHDGPARALLITAAGRGFSSGADLGDASSFETDDVGAIVESHFNPMIEALFGVPIPVVTAINGPAAGAGASLALAGDIVIAGRSAYFLQAFINIGLVPDVGATWMLPRLAGRARAAAMMMLGERVPAEQAEQWGMIYKAVDDANLMPTATAIAERLAKGPTRAHALIRQGLRACMESTLREALAIERANQREAGFTADYAEGVAAFLEKRQARFSGR